MNKLKIIIGFFVLLNIIFITNCLYWVVLQVEQTFGISAKVICITLLGLMLVVGASWIIGDLICYSYFEKDEDKDDDK